MRLRLAAAILVPALALAAPVAGHASHGEEPLTVSGSILVGHPTTGVVGGVTENVAPCSEDLNGVDGYWVNLLDYQGHDGFVSMDDTLDADVFFYDADCSILSEAWDAGFLGEAEGGVVPADAQYAVVNGFAGTGDFFFEVSA